MDEIPCVGVKIIQNSTFVRQEGQLLRPTSIHLSAFLVETVLRGRILTSSCSLLFRKAHETLEKNFDH